jgi:hypothetical protein
LFRTAPTEFVIGRCKSLAAFVATAWAGLVTGGRRFLAPVGTMLAAPLRRLGTLLAPAGAALTGLFTGRRKVAAYAGAVMALAGIGIGTIAATTSPAAVPAAVSSARHATGPGHGFAVNVGDQAGKPSAAASTSKPAASKAPARATVTHKPAAHKAVARKAAARKPAAHKAAARHARPSRPLTWKQARDKLAAQTYPKPAPHKLPLPDRLLPGSPIGAQSYLPVTPSRMANASTIVHQALKRHMGVRSAVIAVATAMQESTLENISYGDRDSLGLFQQRPSCGWGSAAQITNPAYAADSFLSALHSHQSADPDWASKPLWATAQAVQESGFPTAYAKWEAQAAQLVQRIAWHMA